MTKWKWQAISQAASALIAKDQPGLAVAIIIADNVTSIVLTGMALAGSYYGVHVGIGLLR